MKLLLILLTHKFSQPPKSHLKYPDFSFNFSKIMLKKMKFLSLLKSKSIVKSLPYYSCHHQPRTLSFKALANNNNEIFKTINSAFNIEEELSLFTDQSFEEECDDDATSSYSFSTSSVEDDPIETLIHDHKNNNSRLFFELDETSSIFEASKKEEDSSVVLSSLDSNDPFLDFKKSMVEMVEALGLNKKKDNNNNNNLEGLQDLLSWYLKVNAKSNHGYIVGAFVDLLVGLEFNNNINNNLYLSPNISFSPSSSSPNDLSSYSSTFQSSSSCSTSTTTLCGSNSSCLEGEGEGHHNHNHNYNNNHNSSLVISHSSSLLLEQVKEDIIDEASSSSRNA